MRVGAGAVIGPVPAPGLHVMSWNVRRRVPELLARPVDRWARRAAGVAALLAAERPTVLCAQEVLPDQRGALRDGLGRGYLEIGDGRSRDGGGEACPILFDEGRLELVEWEQSALSDAPRRPGSRSWGNLFPRIMVRAVFRDRATHRRIQVVNTHLDPFSPASRVRSAGAIGDLVRAGDAPTVVAGDLNAGPSSEAVRALLGRGLVDSWAAAGEHRTGEWGSYGGYRPPRPGPRIDWILTTPCIRVDTAAVNPSRHGGGWPSDHLPVQAVLRVGAPDGEGRP
ncbi:endonuclease/exonuclease/phosphatase family protein [Dietzia aerolata]|uniref:Endonuclease/exonuclease/phosphatase family protein n=1 Tax=Dietzia aerolata TaxID=595984 RepID=A0ABV5JQE9_9ACTN